MQLGRIATLNGEGEGAAPRGEGALQVNEPLADHEDTGHRH